MLFSQHVFVCYLLLLQGKHGMYFYVFAFEFIAWCSGCLGGNSAWEVVYYPVVLQLVGVSPPYVTVRSVCFMLSIRSCVRCTHSSLEHYSLLAAVSTCVSGAPGACGMQDAFARGSSSLLPTSRGGIVSQFVPSLCCCVFTCHSERCPCE